MNKRVKEIKGVVSGWHVGTIFVRLEDHDGLGIVSIGDKVTIFHEPPERKANITESQFDEVYEQWMLDPEGEYNIGNMVRYMRQKFFGSET